MTELKQLSKDKEDKIISKINELAPWFHNIELANGIFTNPKSDYPLDRWKIVEPELPASLDNKICLDVGCSSGFFSFKLRGKGAKKVVGIDGGEQALAIDQAKFAKDVLEMDRIDFRKLNVYDVDQLNIQFDYTLFLGVFYHLRHPLLALDKLRKVTKEKMIFQTITSRIEEKDKREEEYKLRPLEFENLALRSDQFYKSGYPKLYFVENMLDGDISNKWLPNVEGITAMLRSSGFKIEKIHTLDHEVFVVCS